METKNLCAQIPLELHQMVANGREESGLTLAQYITEVLTDYFTRPTQTTKGGNNMNRTMAFQISEELFMKIKAHLEAETTRTGKKLTQREFVIGLIEEALAQATLTTPTAEETPEDNEGTEKDELEETEDTTTEEAPEDAEDELEESHDEDEEDEDAEPSYNYETA